MFSKLIFALLLSAALGGRHLGRLAPDAAPSTLVKPLKFNQRLLVCNAYTSKSAVRVTKNDQPLMEGDEPLGFQQCRYTPASVLAKDKIDFVLADAGIEGTFEVGELPQTDSVLLLVLQKRDARTPLMAFQSFAFPQNSGRGDAHVAVIDATSDNSKAHLKVADHPLDGSSPLTEELSFNRIYSLAQGQYNMAVDTSKQDLELYGGKDYVLLRTGGSELGAQSLVAFPHDEPPRSGASAPACFATLAVTVASMLFFA